MIESLITITSSITILALVFLFLYVKKFQEITELHRQIEELEKHAGDGDRVMKVREEFLAMIIHELRAPLSVIKGSADLIIREAGTLTKDQISELLDQIKTSSSDLLGMVNDMLDVSKIEAGRFEIYPKDAVLNDVLEEEYKMYVPLASEKGIDFSIHLDPYVSHVRFDPDKIRQVLNNLLSNALKFTPQGGKVDLLSEKVDGKVKITVSDTGIGIPEQIKAKLFNKFVQGAAGNHSSEKGTGLGLVIAKGIVEAHNGSIWMEDNKPKGVKFLFTLPIS